MQHLSEIFLVGCKFKIKKKKLLIKSLFFLRNIFYDNNFSTVASDNIFMVSKICILSFLGISNCRSVQARATQSIFLSSKSLIIFMNSSLS